MRYDVFSFDKLRSFPDGSVLTFLALEAVHPVNVDCDDY